MISVIPERDELVKRIERLEELAKLYGELMLFVVDTEDMSYLVCAYRIEDIFMMMPTQNNVDFVGRASTQYTEPRIIRAW